MKKFDVAVIGAGPAGIMAAVTAGNAGKNVVLIEKNENIGRKILATGNGRCNLTNRNVSPDRYHGSNKKFIQANLEKFDQFRTMEYFESLGVVLKEEDKGRIFPRTNQAATVVEALKHALEEANVDVRTGTVVKNIEKPDEAFVIRIENGEDLEAEKLILTTGGKAAFQFGSSGDGLFWAMKMGHNIVPIFPALAPLETEEEWVKDVQGIKVEAKVISRVDGEIVKETSGDVLFTHYGLSGPAVMAHTGAISPFVEGKQVKMYLDLYPEISESDLDAKIEGIFKNKKKSLKNSLIGLFPAGLVPIILKVAVVDQGKNTSEISRDDRRSIVRAIKNLELTIKKTRNLKEAQVTRGGIDTLEIDEETLESKIVKGLYFAGEIMDVNGDSGGFNLQWAWSTGYVAGLTRQK